MPKRILSTTWVSTTMLSSIKANIETPFRVLLRKAKIKVISRVYKKPFQSNLSRTKVITH